MINEPILFLLLLSARFSSLTRFLYRSRHESQGENKINSTASDSDIRHPQIFTVRTSPQHKIDGLIARSLDRLTG